MLPMADKRRILFICTANAARSQMAQSLLRDMRPDSYEVFSAGNAPTEVDARAIAALNKLDVNTEGLRSKSIDEFAHQEFDYVITLCSKAQAECRTLPNATTQMAWDFEDPQTSGRTDAFAKILREIQQRIQMFLLVTEKNQPSKPVPPLTPVDLFKCLADETRLRVVMLIEREEELCVCELMHAINESQPKISRHLAMLRSNGLLEDRRQGHWVYYRLHRQLPPWIIDLIKAATAANAEWLEAHTQRLNDMGDRPTRVKACCT
jgi:ArsR family transcriptional regulator, arsenate/arsenite/antimonite-responsive transcriptional repressor / arsenate reductase (thioredoxin)